MILLMITICTWIHSLYKFTGNPSLDEASRAVVGLIVPIFFSALTVTWYVAKWYYSV